MGRKIGTLLGNLLDTCIFQIDYDHLNFIKALVELNLKEDIIDKVMAKNNKNETFGVDFKFEKVGQELCYC